MAPCVSLRGMTISLDHVGYAAASLDALQRAFLRLGFAPTTPHELQAVAADGRPRSLAQTSCHAVFEQGYLEFTAVAPVTPTHHLAPWLDVMPRPVILAFGCDDAESTRNASAARGVQVGAVQEAERNVDYGALAGPARFSWYALPATLTPEALCCFVQHRNAERIFQPEVQTHPNGARALLAVEWSVPSARLESMRARYAAMLGVAPQPCGAQAWRFDLHAAAASRRATTALVLRATDAAAPAADRYAATVVIGVSDLSRARQCLRVAGVVCSESAQGVEIAAQEAAGAALRLVVVYPRDSQISGK